MFKISEVKIAQFLKLKLYNFNLKILVMFKILEVKNVQF